MSYTNDNNDNLFLPPYRIYHNQIYPSECRNTINPIGRECVPSDITRKALRAVTYVCGDAPPCVCYRIIFVCARLTKWREKTTLRARISFCFIQTYYTINANSVHKSHTHTHLYLQSIVQRRWYTWVALDKRDDGPVDVIWSHRMRRKPQHRSNSYNLFCIFVFVCVCLQIIQKKAHLIRWTQVWTIQWNLICATRFIIYRIFNRECARDAPPILPASPFRDPPGPPREC